MFWRILKNDLKRKRTMNIILLLFIILAVTFASASINMMVSVYGGIDYFLEKAGVSDYIMFLRGEESMEQAKEALENASSVTGYKKEDLIFYTSKVLKKDGETYVDFGNLGLLTSVDDAKINYFDQNDEVIKEIPKGHVYVGGLLTTSSDVHVGDEITIDMDGTSVDVTIDGYMKDAIFGSPFMSNPRILMNDEDVEVFRQDDTVFKNYAGAIYFIDHNDLKALQTDLKNVSNPLFARESSILVLAFMLDMLLAGILLAVSICLILIAFAMLSFTIKFTLNEDFREIGVMKAVGIRSTSVRGMYMIKYLFIAMIGATIGYICSVPFEKLLMGSIEKQIVIGNDNEVMLGFIGAVSVVLIILAFCYSCTRRVKKLSPVDAVRNGETGERYKKKSVLKLTKSKLKCNQFLGLNDVVSKPKQYTTMVLIFTLCILLITMLANSSNTLSSDVLLPLIGHTPSDVYFTDSEKITECMGNPNENRLSEIESEMEETLKEHNMPGKIHIELVYNEPVEHGENTVSIPMLYCRDTKTTDYFYNEGVAPMYENEIALTPQMLDELEAQIGDTVVIPINGEKKEFIISASFISLNGLGRSGRFHEDVPLKISDLSVGSSFQIDFDDDPDQKEIDKRVEEIKEILDTDKVYNMAQFCDHSTGDSSGMVTSIKNMVILIAVIIAVLIAVLMERSFISKETGEIALMKAIGFKNRSVCAQHTWRFVVVMILSSILAAILCLPFTRLVGDRIFAVMGAASNIEYKIIWPEVFILYPLILGAAVVLSAGVTSLYMKTIHSEDMGNIE